MKRVFASLICLALLVTVFPVIPASAEKATGKLSADDIFAAIDGELDRSARKRGRMTAAEKTSVAKQTVEALGIKTESHGNGFFFFEADGEPCAYSSRVRELAEKSGAVDGVLDDGGVVTVSYATRSNGPAGKNTSLFEPYYGLDKNFTTQYQTEAASVAAATGGTYRLYKQNAATVDAIAAALCSDAVVFFDSHGDTDYENGEDYTTGANSSYMLLQTNAGLTTEDKAEVPGSLGTNYYHAFNSGSFESTNYYCVDGTVFSNHMTQTAGNNLLWMALCLGMATDGLEKPLRDRGVAVVYGYSQSVTFTGDYRYEETFFEDLKDGADVKAAIADMKGKYGYWDPGAECKTFAAAIRKYAAFPIVCSALDAYPGKGNVDGYQTVNSDWTLFGSATAYNIIALSSNATAGTVSLDQRTVTAVPNPGWQVSGCTVDPENACSVTQNGNTFLLSGVRCDCTVTVQFSAKTPAVLTFSVPDGVTCAAMQTYVGDTVSLPVPVGTPTADAQQYRFAGWSVSPTEPVSFNPVSYAASAPYTAMGNRTFYAVYTYSVPVESSDGEYYAVTADRSDWSGEYVISYGGNMLLTASEEYKGALLMAAGAAHTAQSAGVTVSGTVMRGVTDDYLYVIEPVSGAENVYSVRMKSSRNYLAHTSKNNSLTTASLPAKSSAQWRIGYADGAVVLTNVYSGFVLQYYAGNHLFRCYQPGTQQPVTLFSTTGVVTKYTTLLSNKCRHIWTAWSASIPDNCLAGRTMSRCCTICGETETRTEPDCPASQYIDVPGKQNWAHIGIDYCIDAGIMGSTATDRLTFEPTATCTRAMLVSILYRLAGSPSVAYKPAFSDVPAGKWYSAAVSWASVNGVVSGYSDGRFGPDDKITREQLAVLLKNYSDRISRISTSGRASIAGFSDAERVTWSADAVCWAVYEKLLSGKASGGKLYLDPGGNASRQEVAAVLMRFVRNVLAET